eukprot:Transcript_433.p1 GENE.Transcript_433~~Transcript_433.p1  ORF type:complete len:830 (-),score=446.03 Transcript_433:210-2699(-)
MSELSQRKKPNSGESGDGYTPILPEDWKLSGLDAAPPPQELGGPVGKVIKSTSAVFSKLDKGVRREADRRLVSSLRFLLKKIGAIVLTSLHDSAMPRGVHKVIDEVFILTWPEAEKGILDGLVLDLGFQFQKYREKVTDHEAEWPEDFFERCRATLLYAIMPYDLSFFGMMRQPTLFAINLVFLFPLFGVDSICVMTLWLCTYKYDEFQLCSFIIKSKGLGLVTAGLISGAIGFVKLYACSMVNPPGPGEAPSPASCEFKAPGVYSTAEWEFWLYQARVVLLWVTFAQLNFIHPRLAARRRLIARRARAEATLRKRRGMLPPLVTTVSVLVLCAGYAVLAFGYLFAKFQEQGTFLALFSGELSKLPQEVPATLAEAGAALQALVHGGSLWGLLLVFGCVAMTVDVLSNRVYTCWPSTMGMLLASAASGYVGLVFQLAMRSDDEDGAHFLGLALFLTGYSALCNLALMFKQLAETARDRDDLKALEKVFSRLDENDDGTISVDEFREVYHDVFPTYDGTFDELWARIDRNADGKLSRDELAVALGLNHLTVQGEPKAEESPSDALVRELTESNVDEDQREVDEKLMQLQAEKMRLRKHHQRPGGVMFYFFLYDVISSTLIFFAITYALSSQGIHRGDWRYACSLYFLKVAMGLLSAPYLVFMVPVVSTWLTHTRKTAYDKAGDCVPLLDGGTVSKRFAKNQAEQREARLRRKAEGRMTCADKWVETLGTYNEEEIALDQLEDSGQISASEARARKKAQAEKEKELAAAKKVMTEDERAMEDMKAEAKRAFAKKQRQQMEARKPEASLLIFRTDEQTGQTKLAGGEPFELL